MKKFEDTIYSDNLHNYDYDELVESYIMKDIEKNDEYDVDNNATEVLPKKFGCCR